MPTPQELVVCHLGRVAYEPTWALQEEVQERLIAAKRANPSEDADRDRLDRDRLDRDRLDRDRLDRDRLDHGQKPHVLLLLEHPPVYTLGKSGDSENLLASEERLKALDADVHRIGRGGDVTYHGPGQLVGYPLLDLDRFFTDLGRYLRTLEEVVIRACADFGVTGTRVDGRTGVWVGPDDRGLERKICAMGVRCSRWVTMHGFALNVTTDLDYFDHIVPCGIDDRGVTSLDEETHTTVDVNGVRAPLVRHFAEQFDATVTERSGAQARAFLRTYAGVEVVPA